MQLVFLVLTQASLADQSGRLWQFSRSRMEMQHDQIDIEIPVSWSMDHPIYGSPQDGLKKDDKVSELPGQPGKAVFDQYAGYVTVDAASGKALFYYFAEAAEAPTKPLVLWLNGGPGCSSLGGAMLEIGPFYVNRDNKTLSTNKYAWNNEANMLFLESPAGVGFSYSNRTSDYNNTGDRSTAADAYTFLINWLERFPEYKGHDFFITDILGLKINSSWRPWYSDDNEVGGYVVGYDGLVFATVRGAGHMVPTYQPQRALTLFSSFLQGKLPPE
ncbi:hypothetical protein PR202_gb20072 [Eleusine coracana subsp. coracana]|uniref:Uncharacterized protein n=1 Tax=Eleusine coracana subsp. coracana TaxID=191504 RepID=A0AAV5FBN0_ELECO|nr:hypothetical protein PR202_gb20072 [Eleusine coracana subsp. coracana]